MSEVEAQTEVHPVTVRRWISSGHIHASGGGSVPFWVDPESLAEFLSKFEIRHQDPEGEGERTQ